MSAACLASLLQLGIIDRLSSLSSKVVIQRRENAVLIQSKPSSVLACRDSDRLYLLAQSKDPGCTSHSTARLIILS